ncbi:hypothetical protein DFJ73DRAFT_27698 [Zopfochytrium polystomum]|nr:hypothetical protein DFJ73DRAFT_27698 [Zopfochytrium polystomum]
MPSRPDPHADVLGLRAERSRKWSVSRACLSPCRRDAQALEVWWGNDRTNCLLSYGTPVLSIVIHILFHLTLSLLDVKTQLLPPASPEAKLSEFFLSMILILKISPSSRLVILALRKR